MTKVEVKTLRETVVEQIGKSSPQVAEAATSALVQEEVKTRTGLVVNGLRSIEIIEKEIKNIKPDQKQYSVKGEVTSESYSKSKYNELEKLNKKLDRAVKAVETALNNKDFNALRSLDGKGGDDTEEN